MGVQVCNIDSNSVPSTGFVRCPPRTESVGYTNDGGSGFRGERGAISDM